MNLSEAKNRIYEIVSMFFEGATVLWSEQTATKPPVPYVTIRTGSLNKTLFACNDEESGKKYYLFSTILELNLYTKGRPVNAGSETNNITINYENTALDDMMDFIKFLESDAVLDLVTEYGLDIQLNPPVRDLSELMNDTKYRYRSMAEFTVSYTEAAEGWYGISGNTQIPNSSGGGNQAFADAESYVIKEVEIKEEK